VRGCSCGMADYGTPGHDGDPAASGHRPDLAGNWFDHIEQGGA
jgi:hypothetical protein